MTWTLFPSRVALDVRARTEWYYMYRHGWLPLLLEFSPVDEMVGSLRLVVVEWVLIFVCVYEPKDTTEFSSTPPSLLRVTGWG